MIDAKMTPNGSTVTIGLTMHLGPERFAAFRSIIAECGGRYHRETKTNRVGIEMIPRMIALFRSAGLHCTLDETLSQHLRENAEGAEKLAREGAARIAEVERLMLERGETLRPYQRTGIAWLAPRLRALLGDDMGLGKTIQALLALPPNAAVLIIAPGAVSANWLAEAKRWRPDLRGSIAKGRNRFAWPQPGQLVVTTFGSMPGEVTKKEKGKRRQVIDELPLPPPGICLLGDEAHSLKDATSVRGVRWGALRDLVLEAQGRVWLLTGTPMLNNRPKELWNVLEAARLGTEAFGSWPRFMAMFREEGDSGAQGLATAQVPELLQRVMLHRRKADVLTELPSRTFTKIRVELDTETAKLCDEFMRRLEESGTSLESLLSDTGQRKDRSSFDDEDEHGRPARVPFELISKVRAALAAAKLGAALDRVQAYEDEDEPLVLMGCHVGPLREIAKRDGWAMIDGTVKPEDRAAIVRRFQAGELRGLALTFQAGGVGITLTHASNMLSIDLPWTPALLAQGDDRIYRIGQRNACSYVRLVADHILEERVIELLHQKLEAINAAVTASAVDAEEQPASDDAAVALAAREAVEASIESRAAAQAAEDEAREVERVRQEQRSKRARGEFSADCWGQEFGKFRPPQDAVEAHAAGAMIRLAGMDPDRASTRNNQGFSRFDGEVGHSLATSLVEHGRLSPRQWELAKKLAHRYRKQVGEPPKEDR